MRAARVVGSWLSSAAASRRLGRHDGTVEAATATPDVRCCHSRFEYRGALLGESRAGRGCAQRLRGGALAAIKLLDHAGEQAPEERIARIAADVAEFSSAIDQHEDRREALAAHA